MRVGECSSIFDSSDEEEEEEKEELEVNLGSLAVSLAPFVSVRGFFWTFRRSDNSKSAGLFMVNRVLSSRLV